MNTHTRTICVLLAASLGACSGGGQRAVGDQDAGTRSAQAVSGPIVDTRVARRDAVNRLETLASHERPDIRANALEALGILGARNAEPSVALGLADENEGVRAVASMLCAELNLRGLAPALRSLVDNETSPYARCSAIYALYTLDGEADITPIATMLLSERDVRLSSHAAYILGELGNESALPLLRQASLQSWNGVNSVRLRLHRLQIAEAMIKLGDPLGYEAVRASLYPSRPEELEATALGVQIIGEIGDRASIDQLIYMADEETGLEMPAEVKLAIAAALGKLGLGSGGYIADDYIEHPRGVLRAQAASVYGFTGRGEHLARLVGVLGEDPSPLVQASAAASILRLTQS